MIKRILLALGLAVIAMPAAAQTHISDAYTRTSLGELITAPFEAQSGTASVQKYSGLVEITVGGTGQSLDKAFNDAFYFQGGGAPITPGSFYQLAVGTPLKPLAPNNPGSFASQYIRFIEGVGAVPAGTIPAYNASHLYSFVVDLGTFQPASLFFGVNDGNFGDNTGAYTITAYQLQAGVSAAPEPATWAFMILGFGAAGVALRRSRKKVIVAYA